jgi:hypothetical protein
LLWRRKFSQVWQLAQNVPEYCDRLVLRAIVNQLLSGDSARLRLFESEDDERRYGISSRTTSVNGGADQTSPEKFPSEKPNKRPHLCFNCDHFNQLNIPRFDNAFQESKEPMNEREKRCPAESGSYYISNVASPHRTSPARLTAMTLSLLELCRTSHRGCSSSTAINKTFAPLLQQNHSE